MAEEKVTGGSGLELLTPDDVAGILLVSRKHVYKLMASDKSFPQVNPIG